MSKRTLLAFAVLFAGLGLSACGGGGDGTSAPPPAPPPVPTVSLAAKPPSVAYGWSSMLTWSSKDATSCTASGAWSDTKMTSGNEATGALTASRNNYSLTCSSALGGSASATVTVTVSPPTATLLWDAVEDPNLNGYRIYYGTQPGTYIQVRGEGLNVDKAITTYPVPGLSSGTLYYFAATAYDTMGNESDYSDVVFKDIP